MRVLIVLFALLVCVASALSTPLRHVRQSQESTRDRVKGNPVAHTWHNVTTSHGEWSGTLSVLNEQLTFVDPAYNNITQMRFNEKHGATWGTVIYDSDDFNVLYAATFIQQVNSSSIGSPNIALKTCVFIISAYGPADPQITPVSFNGGATCKWQSSGIGENYYVD